jgi:glycosidase
MSAPETTWWRRGVIYQVYPRSFRDTNGDGVGELPGICRSLRYLTWLSETGIWRDGKADGMPPNNWVSQFGGPARTFDATTRQYCLHSFLTAQPDLNWRNAAVQAAMLEVMRFWLDRGVDGFRVDVLWLLMPPCATTRPIPLIGLTGLRSAANRLRTENPFPDHPRSYGSVLNQASTSFLAWSLAIP